MVVEKLLKLLVYKVDRDLFESVVLKDFESSNVQNTATISLFHGGVKKSPVAHVDQPEKQTVVGHSCNCSTRICCLLNRLCLGYPFCTNFDFWLTKCFHKLINVNAQKCCYFYWPFHFIWLCLIVSAFCLEMYLSKRHNSCSNPVRTPFLVFGETENVKSIIGVLQLLVVVDRLNSDLSLRDIEIVIDIICQNTLGLQFWHVRL